MREKESREGVFPANIREEAWLCVRGRTAPIETLSSNALGASSRGEACCVLAQKRDLSGKKPMRPAGPLIDS